MSNSRSKVFVFARALAEGVWDQLARSLSRNVFQLSTFYGSFYCLLPGRKARVLLLFTSRAPITLFNWKNIFLIFAIALFFSHNYSALHLRTLCTWSQPVDANASQVFRGGRAAIESLLRKSPERTDQRVGALSKVDLRYWSRWPGVAPATS